MEYSLLKNVITLVWIILITLKPHTAEEYCIYETFRAGCPENHVIMINKANYGRMKYSKCIKEGEIGCYVDAREYLDKVCSGQNSCEYLTSTQDLYQKVAAKCNAELVSYLEVNYECLEVLTSIGKCGRSGVVTIDKTEAYIPSSLLQDERHLSRCSLQITALPGQTINLTIINFDAHNSAGNCQTFGSLHEPSSDQTKSICVSPARERHLYKTKGNLMNIKIDANKLMEFTHNFMFHYTVKGCANLVAPEYAWTKRVDDITKIGCKHKNMTWHLRCHGNRWHGVVGSCNASSDVIVENPGEETPIFNGLPFKTIIIIAIGVMLIFLICIIAICIKCICLRNRTSGPKHGPHFNDNSLDRNYGYGSKTHKRSSWLYTFKRGDEQRKHIWESPLPEPKMHHAVMGSSRDNLDHKMSREMLSDGGDYMAPTVINDIHRSVKERNMPTGDSDSITKMEQSDKLPARGRPEGDEYTAPIAVDETIPDKTALGGAEYTVPESIKTPHQNDKVEYTSPSNLRFSANLDFPPPPSMEELAGITQIHNADPDPDQDKQDKVSGEGMQCLPHGSQYKPQCDESGSKQFDSGDKQSGYMKEGICEGEEEDEYMLPSNMR